ncbi:hypothetical protein HDV00_004603 [Rhizophlyctis rosea]|nr:hypothetical protein HDV00_004603 [Rhizophlyctis rosea]
MADAHAVFKWEANHLKQELYSEGLSRRNIQSPQTPPGLGTNGESRPPHSSPQASDLHVYASIPPTHSHYNHRQHIPTITPPSLPTAFADTNPRPTQNQGLLPRRLSNSKSLDSLSSFRREPVITPRVYSRPASGPVSPEWEHAPVVPGPMGSWREEGGSVQMLASGRKRSNGMIERVGGRGGGGWDGRVESSRGGRGDNFSACSDDTSGSFEPSPGMVVWVGNLPDGTTEEELRVHFRNVPVLRIRLSDDEPDKRPCAYVDVEDQFALDKVLKLSGERLRGTRLKIEYDPNRLKRQKEKDGDNNSLSAIPTFHPSYTLSHRSSSSSLNARMNATTDAHFRPRSASFCLGAQWEAHQPGATPNLKSDDPQSQQSQQWGTSTLSAAAPAGWNTQPDSAQTSWNSPPRRAGSRFSTGAAWERRGVVGEEGGGGADVGVRKAGGNGGWGAAPVPTPLKGVVEKRRVPVGAGMATVAEGTEEVNPLERQQQRVLEDRTIVGMNGVPVVSVSLSDPTTTASAIGTVSAGMFDPTWAHPQQHHHPQIPPTVSHPLNFGGMIKSKSAEAWGSGTSTPSGVGSGWTTPETEIQVPVGGFKWGMGNGGNSTGMGTAEGSPAHGNGIRRRASQTWAASPIAGASGVWSGGTGGGMKGLMHQQQQQQQQREQQHRSRSGSVGSLGLSPNVLSSHLSSHSDLPLTSTSAASSAMTSPLGSVSAGASPALGWMALSGGDGGEGSVWAPPSGVLPSAGPGLRRPKSMGNLAGMSSRDRDISASAYGGGGGVYGFRPGWGAADDLRGRSISGGGIGSGAGASLGLVDGGDGMRVGGMAGWVSEEGFVSDGGGRREDAAIWGPMGDGIGWLKPL